MSRSLKIIHIVNMSRYTGLPHSCIVMNGFHELRKEMSSQTMLWLHRIMVCSQKSLEIKSLYQEFVHSFDTDCSVEVPWLRVSVSAPGPALWAGRVVVQAVVALQVGDVRIRRVRVRHVAGRWAEVVWGGRRPVQIIPVHLKSADHKWLDGVGGSWPRSSSYRQPELWGHPKSSSPQAVTSTSSVCWTKWGLKN
jgi:hypothetical protein